MLVGNINQGTIETRLRLEGRNAAQQFPPLAEVMRVISGRLVGMLPQPPDIHLFECGGKADVMDLPCSITFQRVQRGAVPESAAVSRKQAFSTPGPRRVGKQISK